MSEQLRALRQSIEVHGDLYDEAQALVEQSPEYEEWLWRVAVAYGRLVVLALRAVDAADALAAARSTPEPGIDMPRCILDHDHGRDEGHCVYEATPEPGIDFAPPLPELGCACGACRYFRLPWR